MRVKFFAAALASAALLATTSDALSIKNIVELNKHSADPGLQMALQHAQEAAGFKQQITAIGNQHDQVVGKLTSLLSNQPTQMEVPAPQIMNASPRTIVVQAPQQPVCLPSPEPRQPIEMNIDLPQQPAQPQQTIVIEQPPQPEEPAVTVRHVVHHHPDQCGRERNPRCNQQCSHGNCPYCHGTGWMRHAPIQHHVHHHQQHHHHQQPRCHGVPPAIGMLQRLLSGGGGPGVGGIVIHGNGPIGMPMPFGPVQVPVPIRAQVARPQVMIAPKPALSPASFMSLAETQSEGDTEQRDRSVMAQNFLTKIKEGRQKDGNK